MLKVDKTTTTKAIQKLIDSNYVYKVHNEKDKRGYNIMPTDKALEVYPIIIEDENKDIDKSFTDFSDDDKEIFLNLLDKMSTNINNNWLDIKYKGAK